MIILGREVTREKLVGRVRRKLEDRGLLAPAVDGTLRRGVYAAVQRASGPLAAALEGLGTHADPTVPITDVAPPEGLFAQVADRVAERAVRALAPELLGRQRAFNAQLRDACTLMGAELVRLRAELDALRAAKAAPRPKPDPAKKPTPRKPAARKSAPRRR